MLVPKAGEFYGIFKCVIGWLKKYNSTNTR